MKKSIWLSVFMLVLPFSVFADDYQKGKELFTQKRYAEAIVFFEETINTTPDWYPAVYMKARCNYHLAKYKDAVRDFNDALTLEVPSENIPALQYYIAKSYMGMKDYQKAIPAFTALITKAPQARHFDLYLNRGECEMLTAMAEEKNNPEQAKTYLNQGIASYKKALESPTRNTKLKVKAAYKIAFAQYKLGTQTGSASLLMESQKSCEKTIDLDPAEKKAHELLISLDFRILDGLSDKAKTPRYKEAVTHINRYLEKWPNDMEMLDKKGKALQGAKDFKGAIQVFNRLVEAQPKSGGAWFSLGSCQMASKQYPTALKSFDKAMSLGEKNPSIYSFSAFCHVQQKTKCDSDDIPRYERAVKILEKGQKELSGQAGAALAKDLEQKRLTLNTLRENLATDNGNHATTIANIEKLMATLDANKVKLRKNQELYLEQPTAELREAIDKSKEAIQQDTASLEKEFSTLNRYVKSAGACGGGKAYPNYARMQALIANRS